MPGEVKGSTANPTIMNGRRYGEHDAGTTLMRPVENEILATMKREIRYAERPETMLRGPALASDKP